MGRILLRLQPNKQTPPPRRRRPQQSPPNLPRRRSWSADFPPSLSRESLLLGGAERRASRGRFCGRRTTNCGEIDKRLAKLLALQNQSQ
jgi:hypothetical protein